jgi:putative SOS response-associated peptidase YedK
VTAPARPNPVTIAGLRDEWKGKMTGETIKSCAMIVTAANGFVAEVHDRMPIVLTGVSFNPL